MLQQYILIDELHNAPTGGHLGIKKTIFKIKRLENMKKFINDCKTCNKNKITRHIKENLIITDTVIALRDRRIGHDLFRCSGRTC